jgi:hypothetical protein
MTHDTLKNIIVEDYLYEGDYIFGCFYETRILEARKGKAGYAEVFYILDDGDIYSEAQLKESGYKYIFISSEDIIDAFKKRFQKEEEQYKK